MADGAIFHSVGPNMWSYVDSETADIQGRRIMAVCKDQGRYPTCCHHACVKSLEAILRRKRESTPELSIQHSMDAAGARSLLDLDILTFLILHGVTSESNYEYECRPRRKPKYYNGWCYKMYNAEEQFFDYTEVESARLLQHLINVGPFVVVIQSPFSNASRITRETPVVVYQSAHGVNHAHHAVAITGFEMAQTDPPTLAGWVFQDNYGPGHGNQGYKVLDLDVPIRAYTFEANTFGEVSYADQS